jgi:phosphohistidine phosphatase
MKRGAAQDRATRRLLLLRHAKSSWDDPGLPDHDRPLAGRGRRACKAIARYLRGQAAAPSLVLCSSAARTRETLERIMPALGSPEVKVERELYGASSAHLLRRLRELPDWVDSVILIGHQPAIQELAVDLAGDGDQLARVRTKFPTAALATLLFAGGWEELRPGCADLVDFVKPKELES